MKIEIDTRSGFCFGVVNAIQTAEQQLNSNGDLYCLGDIVHNEEEVARLQNKGLKVISHDYIKNIGKKKMLIRAHGEPPSTYQLAKANGVEVVDATCPVVLKLQERVHQAWLEMKKLHGTVIIYGKKGHAEVIGLVGQTNGEATVVESVTDLTPINFTVPIVLFSQTTKEPEVYAQIAESIKTQMEKHFGSKDIPLKVNNTICGQVANRKNELASFAEKHDVIVFVSGKKSSNGKMLFDSCKQANNHSFFVSSTDELQPEWFKNIQSVGVAGATSTPQWLMEKVAAAIEAMDQNLS